MDGFAGDWPSVERANFVVGTFGILLFGLTSTYLFLKFKSFFSKDRL